MPPVSGRLSPELTAEEPTVWRSVCSDTPCSPDASTILSHAACRPPYGPSPRSAGKTQGEPSTRGSEASSAAAAVAKGRIDFPVLLSARTSRRFLQIDFDPLQTVDLVAAGPGQQQQPDDVRRLAVDLPACRPSSRWRCQAWRFPPAPETVRDDRGPGAHWRGGRGSHASGRAGWRTGRPTTGR